MMRLLLLCALVSCSAAFTVTVTTAQRLRCDAAVRCEVGLASFDEFAKDKQKKEKEKMTKEGFEKIRERQRMRSQGKPTSEWSKSTLPVGAVDLDKYCLLYTSPSPRDGLLSRMPSSA